MCDQRGLRVLDLTQALRAPITQPSPVCSAGALKPPRKLLRVGSQSMGGGDAQRFRLQVLEGFLRGSGLGLCVP